MAVLIVAAVVALLAALTVRAEAGTRSAGVDPRSGGVDPRNGDETGATTDGAGPVVADLGRKRPVVADLGGERAVIGPDDDDLDALDALAGPCDDCDVATLSRLAAHGPSVREVVAAAQRAAGVAAADDPTSSWRRRSRWSSLIPWITVRAGNTQSWRDVDDPTLLTVHHAAAFDGRLAWHLDHLVFDPNELRFTAFELSRRRDRRKLAAIASRAYFAWLRAAIATERDPRWQLRLAEAEAALDALTDGWFSRVLADGSGKVQPTAR